MKNNNHIRHMPYLKNSVAYDHEFWYTCDDISRHFFIFLKFSFFGLLGGRGGGGQREKFDPYHQK